MTQIACNIVECELCGGQYNSYKPLSHKCKKLKKAMGKKELKVLEVDEVRLLVIESYKEIIDRLTAKVQPISEGQRWLVMARIINMCFRHFYLTTIKSAENTYPEYKKP